MGTTYLFFITGIVGGLLIFLALIKRSTLKRVSGEEYVLSVPLFGIILKTSLEEYQGLFTEEWIQLKKKLQKIEGLIDVEKMFRYADQYGIDYIGFEGDRPDGSWSTGKFAFCNMSQSHKRPYSVYLNPELDLEAVSHKLSRELNVRLNTSDVYPFLFLHEVGHTSKAGNKNFFAAVLTHTISGDRHSINKRLELFRLKGKIEKYADRFALKELENFR